MAFVRCRKCRGGTPTGERPRWGRDRIPKDADGRLRVYRRLAVLIYSGMIRKSGIRFSEKIMLHYRLNVIWRQPESTIGAS